MPSPSVPAIHGFVAAGFDGVRDAFRDNFIERGEIGAAVAAYWYGRKVVDLWGGRRLWNGDAPWDEGTMVVVHSTTKGMAAMTMAVAHARGWLDYDAPIARYWPEFAQQGKEAITVRQLLGHQAGLAWLDEPVAIDDLHDLDGLARVLARQTPKWPPGTRHGYHAITVGLYAQEIFRRVEPRHRTIGQFFAEEIAAPLGLDFHFGVPEDMPAARLATIEPLGMVRALAALSKAPWPFLVRLLWPWSLVNRSMRVLAGTDPNDRHVLAVEMAAGNGVGTARAIARLYSVFAEGGAEVGVGPKTMAQLTADPVADDRPDVVIGVPSQYSLGFLKPGRPPTFGSSPRAFGTPGAGGSFGFADPDAHLGFAYVMNKTDFNLLDDPREKALRDAVMAGLAAQRNAA
jgi:CubicO group peptidase (beta-lactamase class C family)